MLLPPANEVWGKVIFSQASVILLTGGSGETPLPGRPPPSLQGRPPGRETSLPGRPPPARETPSRPTSRGEIEGDLLECNLVVFNFTHLIFPQTNYTYTWACTFFCVTTVATLHPQVFQCHWPSGSRISIGQNFIKAKIVKRS